MPEFKMFDKVLVRDSEDDIWTATFFSHYRRDGKVMAINEALWEYCIPALGNEHLVGTKNSEWVPKKGDLVAVRNSIHSGWFLRIFYGTAIRFILQEVWTHLTIIKEDGNIASQQKSILNLILRRIDNA